MAKASITNLKKITLTNPKSGREFQIDEAIYTPFKAAILESLKDKNAKTFTQLTDETEMIVRKKMPGFKRSIPWYTISILLDMQTRGLVESYTEKNKKLNRLKIK